MRLGIPIPFTSLILTIELHLFERYLFERCWACGQPIEPGDTYTQLFNGRRVHWSRVKCYQQADEQNLVVKGMLN